MLFRLPRVPMLLALALAVPMLPTGPAQAQNVYDRIDRMERDLANMQRYVYSGGGGAGAGPGGGGADAAYRGRVDDRLNTMESELRDVTGRVEEMNYAIRRMQERLDKLVQDVDFRLTALERGGQGGGQAGGGSAPPPLPPLPTTSPRAGGSDMPPPIATTTYPRGGAPATPEPPRQPAQPASLPSGSAMEQYAYAQQLVAQTRYDEAEGALREFLRRNPNSQLSDNARYWLGETYYVRKRYEEAATTFLESYQTNPKGSKAADSLLKLGLSLSAMRKGPEACIALTKLTREFPTGETHILRRAEQEKSQLACS